MLVWWSVKILKGECGMMAVLQSIEDVKFTKTVQKVHRQTFPEKARIN